MREIKKIFKISSIYFIGNVLMRLIGVIMLPIYTLYISPTEFGKYDVSVTYVNFLASVLFFDIWSGMLRFMFDYSKSQDKEKVITTSWAIFGISCLLYTLVFILAFIFYKVDYIIWIYFLGITMNIQNMYSFIARGYGANRLYMFGGLCGSFVVACCNYLLLAIFKWDYSSLYLASILGSVVNALVILCGLRVGYNVTIKYSHQINTLFKEMFLYSLPLCVNSVAFWFLSSYNRIFIANNLSYYENGIYAVSLKFVVALSMVTECVRLAWQEMSFAYAGNKDKDKDPEYYSKAVNFMGKCLYIGAIILIPVINFIYPYFVNSQYNEAQQLIPMGILAGCVTAMSAFLGNIFGAIKQTKYLFITLVISSIVNVVALYLLLPKFGVACINIALFWGFFSNCVLRIIMLKKYIIIRYDIVWLLIFLVVYGGLYLRNMF